MHVYVMSGDDVHVDVQCDASERRGMSCSWHVYMSFL